MIDDLQNNYLFYIFNTPTQVYPNMYKNFKANFEC